MNAIQPSCASCMLCPRNCAADRQGGDTGFCGEKSVMRVALASLHYGEEPPIAGNGGSGTIFFTGCTLGCSFCQNYQISRDGLGKEISESDFADICIDLQNAGAENINLVTGTQFAPGIVSGLALARERGLAVPALWNSSGYETPETIDMLSSEVKVWLPDLKTLDSDLAKRFFNAPDYPQAAKSSILKMASLGQPLYNKLGAMVQGVIVRHLVLPGMLENTRSVLEFFAEHLRGKAVLSLMTQYTPIPGSDSPDEKRESLPEMLNISRAPETYIDKEEYDEVLAMLEESGIDDGFYQELVTGDEWLPDFTKGNPFSSSLAKPVWHC